MLMVPLTNPSYTLNKRLVNTTYTHSSITQAGLKNRVALHAMYGDMQSRLIKQSLRRDWRHDQKPDILLNTPCEDPAYVCMEGRERDTERLLNVVSEVS